MTVAEAVRVVREQTIPSLGGSGGSGHVEALETLISALESAPVEAHMVCEQKGCDAVAMFRIFWPGHPPGFVCPEHRAKAVNLASALGFTLHTEAL